MIKLNLGSCDNKLSGYINIDKYDDRADIKADIFELNFYEYTIDEILFSHVIEHINPFKISNLLRNFYKMLKIKGTLVIETPDVGILFSEFKDANRQRKYEILNGLFCTMNLTGVGDPENIISPHLFGWTPDLIIEHLVDAGFSSGNITVVPPVIQPHYWNFRIEAKK